MNILFITISGMSEYKRHDIYSDVLYGLLDEGHNVFAISSNQRRMGAQTSYKVENGLHVLRVKIGNITKCGTIEKGISTLLVKIQYKSAIRRYLNNIKFDLVLYTTPPITISDVVKYVKKRDNAKTYLMLKDIFPQNAIDLGMMSKSGIRRVLYVLFRKEEKKLYLVSDKIGGMSPANVEYILNNNPEIPKNKVEVFPNCLDPLDLRVDFYSRERIRKKYNIPNDRCVFVYGGNLGAPQGISFIIEALRKARNNSKAFFLIVGDGTEYGKLLSFVEKEPYDNIRLLKRIPKEDYDVLVGACDVGLIFLDYRFTIPNFPSRLLSYLQAGLPVLCATDPNTDIGKIAEKNGFGWWCKSNDIAAFCKLVDQIVTIDTKKFGEIGYLYLRRYYTVENGIKQINKLLYKDE